MFKVFGMFTPISAQLTVDYGSVHVENGRPVVLSSLRHKVEQLSLESSGEKAVVERLFQD